MPHEPLAEGAHFSAGSACCNHDACDRSRYSEASVRQVGTEGSSEVPTHIKGLLEDIQINDPPDVRNEAARLIAQYSDVFAVSDLDKAEFTAIEQQL